MLEILSPCVLLQYHSHASSAQPMLRLQSARVSTVMFEELRPPENRDQPQEQPMMQSAGQ
jgi:hypothetical protein